MKRLAVCCLLLFLSGHVLGQTKNNVADYQTALNTCIEQQFSEQDSPKLNDKLELIDSCPDLSVLIESRESANFISPPLSNETSLNRLLDERHLLEQAYSSSPTPLTNIQLVSELVKTYDFNSPGTEEPGWFARFKQWLKEKYGNNDEEADIDWLIELLDGFSMPKWLGETIYYVSIGLIILLAIVMIGNELRHYKRFKNRDEHTNDFESPTPLHHLRKLDWDEVQSLPLNEKTSALLQYLIQQCINRQWLPNNNSFTNREFCNSLKEVDASKAAQFNQVINAAEQDIYGNHPLELNEIKKLFLITEEMLKENEVPSS